MALLLLALQAQESGQLDAAQELGRAAARDAEATGDVPTQAHALIFLAELGSALSRHREAHDTSQRAAFLCKTMGDVQGEAMALMLVGHTAGNLGRYEDAIEAALLSVKLLEELPLDPTTVMALTILGVVYMWGRNWDRAHQAFDSAVVAAGRCEPKVDVAYAVLNRALADILKHVYDRADQSGTSGDVEAQSALARRIERVIAGPPGRAPTPAGQRFFESLWQVCQTIVSIWLGHTQRVEQLMAATQEQLVRAPTALWLDFWHEWTKLELAWQRGDLAAAEHAAEQGFAVAVACENEQLACCALTTAGQLAELQGETARALTIQKRVRGRELSIRTEAMRRRERVVQWQLDMRHSEASLRALEVSSRTLERLSLEDPLTGIANRRSFERSVQVMLADRTHGGSPLCVALIDVDQFKRINDHHSHQVGDRVLQAIAKVLVQNIRENDVAARLAGDEFVIALRHDLDVATRVCERICEGVAQFDWSTVAPALSAGISIGVAQAQPGDTVEALLNRSDIAMYAFKNAGAQRRSRAER